MPRVHERDGRAEDALARAEVIDELADHVVHARAVHRVDVRALHRRLQGVEQECIGDESSVAD